MMFKSVFTIVSVAALLCAGGLRPNSAESQVFYSVRGLLQSHFQRSGRVSFIKVRPTAADKARIEARLGGRLARDEYTFYVAETGGRREGFALFDEERGQHEMISFATFFDAAGAVSRVEVVAYREPYGDGVRTQRFRSQFVGRDARSGFRADRDIDIVSGATISSRSLCAGVARAAVLLDELVLSPARSQHAAR